MNVPLISFFTGGGFLDLGFEAAGFEVKWTNEINPDFCKIYSAGMSSWRKSAGKRPSSASISRFGSIDSLKPGDVLSSAFPNGRPGLFGVIGGPPCTDFSVGGLHASHEGDAGKLTAVYVKMLAGVKPDFFLLENVPHLETHPKHRETFLSLLGSLEAAGYAYVINKLNALEYGIPQDRLRLFVVGFRRELLREWFPSYAFPKRALAENFKWPAKSHEGAKRNYLWPKTIEFGGTPGAPSSIPLELCVNAALKGRVDPETLPNGLDFFNPHSDKFGKIAEGDVSGKSFKRLHRFRYSPTAWYGNNEVHLHPWKKRRLSVREALRLQSVPDEYVMPDDVPLCAKFKVIGNGVPCVLAESIAESLLEFIRTRANLQLRPQRTLQSARGTVFA